MHRVGRILILRSGGKCATDGVLIVADRGGEASLLFEHGVDRPTSGQAPTT
jgi:hypothetical protein